MSETSLRDRLLVATLPAGERENGKRLLAALACIEGKLSAVESELESRTRSKTPTIALIGEYLVEGGGKRIRPALLLLAARILGYDGEKDVKYAAVIELIHTATLVHDDIIDAADTRRGRPSVNHRWGNELTVLFGDYLYMKSMEIALEEGDLRILKLLSDVTIEMTEGEIIGSELRGAIDTSLEQYLDIVRRKTALLFGAACRIPSYLPGTMPLGDTLFRYGIALGTAFQLQDDLLDYTASEKDLGKPVLSDLREGKLTLPLILVLPEMSRAEREMVSTVLEEESFSSVRPEQILGIVGRLSAVDRARELMEQYASEARSLALALPASTARDGLLLAAEYAATRRK